MAKIKFGKRAKKVGDKAEVPAPSSPAWMTTMGDMNNLLLCFFVMLFNMNTSMDESKIQLLATAFTGSFGVMTGGMTISPGQLIFMGHNSSTLPSMETGRGLAPRMKTGEMISKLRIDSRYVKITHDERGFVISLASDFFFEPGGVDVRETPEIIDMLRSVVDVIESVPNDVRIEGHTDNTIIAPSSRLYERYPSNWELSSQRAINVLKTLYNLDVDGKLQKLKNRFSVSGFADTRPVASNDLPDGRRQNRRVDIVIVREDVTYYNQQ